MTLTIFNNFNQSLWTCVMHISYSVCFKDELWSWRWPAISRNMFYIIKLCLGRYRFHFWSINMVSVWKVESASQFDRKIKAHHLFVLQWRIFQLQCKTDIHVTHVKTCSLHKQVTPVLKGVTKSKAASVTLNIMHSYSLLTPLHSNTPQICQT